LDDFEVFEENEIGSDDELHFALFLYSKPLSLEEAMCKKYLVGSVIKSIKELK